MDNKKDFNIPNKVEESNKETNQISRKKSPILAGILGSTGTVLMGGLMLANTAQAGFNVPTDMSASPLTINGKKADPFTAKMLMFEEFGLEDISDSTNSDNDTSNRTLPSVADCDSMPNGAELDEFLRHDLYPQPERAVNETDPTLTNAWDAMLRQCNKLTADLRSYAEGRPNGEWFAHQRWEEFPFKEYFQTAMTGARVNGGLRDKYQLHEYKVGEFGPGGLYFPGLDPETNKPSTKGTEVKIHPNLPAQSPYSVWTFDGTLPPKLLMARYGETILFRHWNALPINEAANNGFGMHTISTHEHNGHNPAESDGYAHAYFYPGQFYDYHWPMILAGYDTYNFTDPKAGSPDGNGGITPIRGDSRETMSTHWFHDHMLDYTAQNVYKGNAAMMNYYSAIDRGREPANTDEATGVSSSSSSPTPGYTCNYANASSPNLCLPSGSNLDWGNRDYDVNLVVADKAWGNDGQLKFNIFNTDGFLGDRITVNWVYKPYLDVRARKYRFRILNGSVSRYYKIAIVKENVDASGKKTYDKIPYYMIANDGNIMQHAVPFPNSQSPDALPEQGIAERYDIVIDFKGMEGKNIYFVNLAEHENGKGPSKYIPLTNVLNGSYVADGKLGDPGVGMFLQLRVKPYSGVDLSMNPADYVEGKKQMIPLPKPTQTELKNAVHRTFKFGKFELNDTTPWGIETDGGALLNANHHRVSAAPTKGGKTEIWHFVTKGNWAHPIHVHFEEGQILYRGGRTPPPWEKYARKDVYRVGPLSESAETVDIAIKFREFEGTYVEHCHNTQHEDKAMLLRWDSQRPGQTIPIPSPELGWEGAVFDPALTETLPTYKTGDLKAAKDFIIPK